SSDPESNPEGLPLLLTSSSELIVAPKSRHLPPQNSSTKSHDLSTPAPPSNSSSHSHLNNPEWILLRKKLLRLLPLSLTPQNPFLGASNDELEGEGDEMYLSRGTVKKLQDVWGRGNKLSLTVQTRPSNHSGSAKGGEDVSMGTGPGSEGGSKSTNPTNSTNEEKTAKAVEVRVRESNRICDGQVWIGESLREELGLIKTGETGGENADGSFELLRLGPPINSTSSKKPNRKEQQRTNDQKAAAGTSSPHLNGHSSLKFNKPSLTSLTAPITSNGHSPNHSTYQSAPILAGVESQLASLTSHIINSLTSRKFASSASSSSITSNKLGAASGILVTGASGSGKTALIREIGRKMEKDPRALTRTIYIDCSKYSEERPVNLKNRIKDWFDQASWYAPSLLLLDNLDRLIPTEVEHADSFASLHLANNFMGIAQQALENRPIIAVATAQGTTSLHPLLSSTHLLGETVSLKGPTKSGRKDILNSLIQSKTSSSNLSLDTKFNSASIAAITEGYLPADLKDFVDRAVHQSAIRTMSSSPGSGLILTADDFNQAQIGFVPLSLRDVKLQKSEVQWSDIGGLHETRKTLRETLEWPTKYGAIFASCPLRLRSGLLLYGYPGCGKTLLASAVAKECGLNFISVKGPEILNKYIGASEKSVRDLFDRAQAAKPCVLFFDEFDSIAPKRGHDSTGVTDRVVNQMLTQMDGAEGLDGVYVLAATSRPDLIDPALLRPGRLDKSLLCDMPSYSDRLEIMQACSRKLHLSPSISLEEFAKLTQGYSGADLQALMYNAHLDAIHTGLNAASEVPEGQSESGKKTEDEEIKFVEISGTSTASGDVRQGGGVRSKAEQAVVNKRLEQILSSLRESRRASSKASKLANDSAQQSGRKQTIVEPHHLRKSLETTRPSVPTDELHRLHKIYNDFVSTRSKGGLPSGEASDQVGGRASLM
ncbi:hypothetical protein JCM3765_000928, partial [Sporobolomyces pararoseus]